MPEAAVPQCAGLELREVVVEPVGSAEERRYLELLEEHHYLGALGKIGETLWYVAKWRGEWLALVSFSASALKCAARDRWIGWENHQRFNRLKLVINNSRFLILPAWHFKNLGSRVLALCQRRIVNDWSARFGHSVVLLETFVDPERFQGTVYRAANWIDVGRTHGFRRTQGGYTAHQSPKIVLLQPLRADAQRLLCSSELPPPYRTGEPTRMLTAVEMQSLPSFFTQIPDPRRGQGRRHRLSVVLALIAAATLCGMRGYEAISDWVQTLSQRARKRFRCRMEEDGSYSVPSLFVIRDVMVRVNPAHLDRALERWNEVHSGKDDALAIDGKTMCNAKDENGRQTHIMSVIGHSTGTCYAQKK